MKEVHGTIAISALDRLKLECAVNQSLRDALKSDPVATLKKHGIDVPTGVDIKVAEDDPTTHTLVLPPFVGTDTAKSSVQSMAAASASTWECTTCTPTSPICAGSLASLTCA